MTSHTTQKSYSTNYQGHNVVQRIVPEMFSLTVTSHACHNASVLFRIRYCCELNLQDQQAKLYARAEDGGKSDYQTQKP